MMNKTPEEEEDELAAEIGRPEAAMSTIDFTQTFPGKPNTAIPKTSDEQVCQVVKTKLTMASMNILAI